MKRRDIKIHNKSKFITIFRDSRLPKARASTNFTIAKTQAPLKILQGPSHACPRAAILLRRIMHRYFYTMGNNDICRPSLICFAVDTRVWVMCLGTRLYFALAL